MEVQFAKKTTNMYSKSFVLLSMLQVQNKNSNRKWTLSVKWRLLRYGREAVFKLLTTDPDPPQAYLADPHTCYSKIYCKILTFICDGVEHKGMGNTQKLVHSLHDVQNSWRNYTSMRSTT